MSPRIRSGIRSGAVRLGLALALCSALLFRFSVVRGHSMAPGILDGDRILVDPLRYLLGDVGRGDVVVLRSPLDPQVDYVKRVVGLPGDLVEIDRGCVRVNGVDLEEPYLAVRDRRVQVRQRVAPDHLFVLGDNRPSSCDSREFGQIPRGHVRGRVDARVWPLGRMGAVR